MLAIPTAFIWTKIGPDSSQSVDPILRRKELERLAGDGVFWRGVGEISAPNSVREAWRIAHTRTVLATETRLATKTRQNPTVNNRRISNDNPIFTWSHFDHEGRIKRIPSHVVVTSDKPNSYYALVCSTETTALSHFEGTPLWASTYEHLTTKKPITPQHRQNTFPVRHVSSSKIGKPYYVAFRARLQEPYYCVQLHGQRELSEQEVEQLHSISEDGVSVEGWVTFANAIRAKDPIA
jgi:hypothetical protein